MNFRSIARNACPPGLVKLLRYSRNGITFTGDYSNWFDAARQSTGYESEAILEKVLASALKVKEGRAIAERDSVLFDQIPYSFPVLAGLLHAATVYGNRLSVLDFGGALGSSYFHCHDFLSVISKLEWSIIEQPHFVAAGKEHFENEQLRFYSSLEECLQERQPQVALLSAVISWLSEPHSMLDTLVIHRFPYLIFDRTAFLKHGSRDRLTIQTVPPEIYSATYPVWFLQQERFFDHFAKDYDCLLKFDLPGYAWNLDGETALYRGAILTRKDQI